MAKPRDPHRRHQQLMQKLDILVARIRVHEREMNKRRRTLPTQEWEEMVWELKRLTDKKEALYREIRNLER